MAFGAGALTFAAWTRDGEPDQAVERTVTVLVIACPHALGLAIPLVIAISTAHVGAGRDPREGPLALERMRTVATVLFDKTGTLTRGAPDRCERSTVDGGDEARSFRLAAARGGR